MTSITRISLSRLHRPAARAALAIVLAAAASAA
jgi:hypothetical protein